MGIISDSPVLYSEKVYNKKSLTIVKLFSGMDGLEPIPYILKINIFTS